MRHSWALLLSLLLAGQGQLAQGSTPSPPASESNHESNPELSGGETTVYDTTRNAFSLPARNLREEHRAAFFVGNSFFNQNWIIAPASAAARDGLGPLYNARSCSSCHFKDGRGRPPESGEPMRTSLLRISIPGTNAHGGPKAEPVYGDQIQGDAIPGVPREGDVVVQYETISGCFDDGEVYALRQPRVQVRNPGYGALAANVLTSTRVAPAMIGLGLLEAIPEETLRALADPDDRNGDGISGRMNLVWNAALGGHSVGRFGWKAEQPSILQHTAAAFQGDIGVTSTLLPDENHTSTQQAAVRSPHGGNPELSDSLLQAVALYARTLAVPARRDTELDDVKHGRQLFLQLGCAACHLPEAATGDVPDLPELSRQRIQPFTDLLLHDMGEGLADHRPVFQADGREWRTPPLWGLGLLHKVSGHTFLLHDGRARNAEEAILWHDGEAARARSNYRRLSRQERKVVLTFLDSL